MSVLIKGMEMPTGNDELRLIIRSNGQVIISHKTHYEEAEAVPVPGHHGRLIDADALYERAKMRSERFNGCFNDLDNVINALYIETFPTVLEAEEGE